MLNTPFIFSMYPIYLVFLVPIAIQAWVLYSLWEDLATGEAWNEYLLITSVIWVPFCAGYWIGRMVSVTPN